MPYIALHSNDDSNRVVVGVVVVVWLVVTVVVVVRVVVGEVVTVVVVVAVVVAVVTSQSTKPPAEYAVTIFDMVPGPSSTKLNAVPWAFRAVYRRTGLRRVVTLVTVTECQSV